VTAILAVRDLEVAYGSIPALHGIELSVEKGEIVTLIGANGAGKTTTLRTISGLLKPRRGDVFFGDKTITGLKPHLITALGVSHVPEGRGIFANLTVNDNLELGAYLRKDKITKAEYERVFTLFPVLRDRIKQNAGTLSGGEQQMLAISRAMMLEPKIILLDEPTEGLMPRMVSQIRQIIDVLHRDGVAILLVEQNVPLTLESSQRIYIMEKGIVRHHCAASELDVHHAVIRQYLGV